MSQPNGREWVYELLLRCNVFHTPFVGVDSKTNFNCGAQNVGLQLFHDIVSAAPDFYQLMMREANERDYTNDSRFGGDHSGLNGGDSGTEAVGAGDSGEDGTDDDERFASVYAGTG